MYWILLSFPRRICDQRTNTSYGMGFDFSVSPSGQSSQTVSSGQSASFALNLPTMGGSGGTFAFSCSSLPTNSSCTFNPPNETVNANATGSVTVRIATGLSSTSAQNTGPFPRPFAFGSFFVGFGLILMPVAAIRRRERCTFLLSLLLILSSFGLSSCAGAGGGGGAAPSNPTNGTTSPGAYSVVVTATANGLSHKISLNLTVD